MNANKNKRLLAICDLGKNSWCIGELLHFQMETLINRIRHGVDKIDVIWIYDRKNPAGYKAIKTGRITRKNSKSRLEELLPLARVNPHLGSFALMGFNAMNKFVENNSDRYVIDPPIGLIRGRRALYPYVFSKIADFYEERRFLPLLSCQSDPVGWARRFLKKVGGFPVVVQLRKSRYGCMKREDNSPLKEWLKFFARCRKRFKEVKFVVVCRKEEIGKKFEESALALGNVVFSKKHGKARRHSTTVEQDCALIQSSGMCMGSSGTMVMAWYCGVPYLFFDSGYVPNLSYSPYKKGGPLQFIFAASSQRFVSKAGQKGNIMREFEKLYGQIKGR